MMGMHFHIDECSSALVFTFLGNRGCQHIIIKDTTAPNRGNQDTLLLGDLHSFRGLWLQVSR